MKKKIKSKIQILPNIKLWEINILFIVAICILISFGWKMDVDSWFILNTGRYILSHGFTTIEPFTVHTNLSYSAQQWLYTILIWPLYKYIGASALFILEIILFILIYFLSYKLCKLVSDNNKKVSAITSSIFTIILAYTGCISMRPQLFTFINLLLYLIILEKFNKTKNWKTLLWMIPISILQINIHAALWWMLFVFCCPFIAEEFYNLLIKKEKSKNNIMYLITVIIISFFCGLINPYGIKSILYFPLSNNKYVSKMILEMTPINIISITGLLVITTILIHYYMNMKNYQKTNNTKISYTLLLFGTFILVLNAIKCLPLFWIASIYPLAYYFKDYCKTNKDLKFPNTTTIYKIIYFSIIIIILSTTILSSYKIINLSGKHRLNESTLYLKDKYGTENIRLYIDLPLGSYAEYEGFKCYIDTRVEIFYKNINKEKDIFNEYYLLQNKKINPEEFIEKYKFTHIIVYKDSDILYDQDEYSNYHILHQTDTYKIFERNDFQS